MIRKNQKQGSHRGTEHTDKQTKHPAGEEAGRCISAFCDIIKCQPPRLDVQINMEDCLFTDSATVFAPGVFIQNKKPKQRSVDCKTPGRKKKPSWFVKTRCHFRRCSGGKLLHFHSQSKVALPHSARQPGAAQIQTKMTSSSL